jgi:hypothetical protein
MARVVWTASPVIITTFDTTRVKVSYRLAHSLSWRIQRSHKPCKCEHHLSNGGLESGCGGVVCNMMEFAGWVNSVEYGLDGINFLWVLRCVMAFYQGHMRGHSKVQVEF